MDIKYEIDLPENCERLIIGMHGLDSSRKSIFIEQLQKQQLPQGWGMLKFDWPGHGDDRQQLDLKLCLEYLEEMLGYAQSLQGIREIAAVGSSLAGYLILLYRYQHPGAFNKMILRSPAIRMYDVLMDNILDEQQKKQLETEAFTYTADGIRINREFVEELKDNDLFRLYEDKVLNDLFIIQGTADEITALADCQLFSRKHTPHLAIIDGADHDYTVPGTLQKALKVCDEILNG